MSVIYCVRFGKKNPHTKFGLIYYPIITKGQPLELKKLIQCKSGKSYSFCKVLRVTGSKEELIVINNPLSLRLAGLHKMFYEMFQKSVQWVQDRYLKTGDAIGHHQNIYIILTLPGISTVIWICIGYVTQSILLYDSKREYFDFHCVGNHHVSHQDEYTSKTFVVRKRLNYNFMQLRYLILQVCHFSQAPNQFPSFMEPFQVSYR